LSALVREPGGGQQLDDAALRPSGGELAEDVAQVVSPRRRRSPSLASSASAMRKRATAGST